MFLCLVTVRSHTSVSEPNESTVVTGSGKTLAFGIPMIHTILEWRNSSEKPDDDNTKATTPVESLYLPESAKLEESTIEEDEVDDTEEEEGEGEDIAEQDQSGEDDGDTERLGCVQVIDDAEFDFDQTSEAEKKPTGQAQPLLGLVLTPTRELAVQVKHHIDAVAKFTGKSLKYEVKFVAN